MRCNIPCLLLTDSFKDAGGICKGLLENSERDVAMLEMRRNLPKPEMFNLHSVIASASNLCRSQFENSVSYSVTSFKVPTSVSSSFFASSGATRRSTARRTTEPSPFRGNGHRNQITSAGHSELFIPWTAASGNFV